MYKTITVKLIVKDSDAKVIHETLGIHLEVLKASYYNEISVKNSTNKEVSIVERIASAFEEKLPIGTLVKVSKRGLRISHLIKRPEIPVGTKGKIMEIDKGSFLPFLVKFDNGKTVYCGFHEIEED